MFVKVYDFYIGSDLNVGESFDQEFLARFQFYNKGVISE